MTRFNRTRINKNVVPNFSYVFRWMKNVKLEVHKCHKTIVENESFRFYSDIYTTILLRAVPPIDINKIDGDGYFHNIHGS